MKKAEPFNFENKIYYPLFKAGCKDCHANLFCDVFKTALTLDRPENARCSRNDGDIIWQHGKRASVQYITKRLTT